MPREQTRYGERNAPILQRRPRLSRGRGNAWATPLAAILAVLSAGLIAAACGGDTSSKPADRAPAPGEQAQAALVRTVVQVGNPQAAAPAGAVPSGWDTEWSQMMGVRLLQTFEPSGTALWDAAEHPLVYFASEGPGYGGLTSSGVSLPGYQAIDAITHEVLAAPHFDIGGVAKEDADFLDVQGAYFEPHGLGVSPDGRFIYLPTAAGANFRGDKEAGRLLVVNAKTGTLAQIIQVPGRPHHIKSFVDIQGNDRVLAYSWDWGAYILDPLDDNRVVGAVPNGILNGRGYLAFVDPSGRWLFYTVRPPRGVEAQGTVAIIDTETWQYVRSIGIEDSSPIFVAFTADGRTAFVTGGHESKVAKIDMSEEDPADWKLVKVARAGTEGPYGLNLNWTEDMIVTIGKGEGSHNKGITVGLVDPRMVGSARPLGEIYTGCLRADHGILHPDPEANEIWISCNSSFETIIFDLSKKQSRGDFSPEGYVKDRIPTPNGGSTHNGAFVRYSADWTGRVLADQNGLHGAALAAKREILSKTALNR